ncbi:DivIVA domain-containing protein [Blastococcus sp. TF02-8]|uniref:DivIVA domain-containing protein n=1 Tax=Blastococcus sp. TF02-8 TaxID=2250574 RepID=UPI0014126847|nr:DivIVA domain-containing protein [Blastococcus sp. TF02-8]
MRSVRRVEFVENRVMDGEAAAGLPPEADAPRPPRLTGDLDTLLDHRPAFRGSVRGYDRLEVDNYVAWAEGELAAAQREREHLLDRIVAGATELEISRRLLAERPQGRAVVSDRVGEVLRLAEDQAAQVMAAADADAARVLADARLEADARLRKAHEIKELAADVADQLRADAQRDRAEAAAVLAQAHRGAEVLLQEAAEERERLAAQAVADRERIAAEVADLHRQRDAARAALRELTDRIGEALRAVGVADPDELVLAAGPGEPVSA